MITLEDVVPARAGRGRGAGPRQSRWRWTLGRLGPGGKKRPAATPAVDVGVRHFRHRGDGGPGVTGFAPGDAVFGVTNPRFTGGYADYAIASAAMLAKKPDMLSHVDAASVPVVAVTAWQALFEQAQLSRGQSVLIHGAAGSVGAFAVQLAHRAGLWVHATASGRDLDYVRSLGADTVLDGHTARFEDVFPSVDAVIDLVGGELQTRSFAVLHKGVR